ncbi:MAG: hypothetical protein E7549_00375 [Ruminococcaceae bacterium]|nr:hypothetical protein [Oscillospiraceae bacterium]
MALKKFAVGNTTDSATVQTEERSGSGLKKFAVGNSPNGIAVQAGEQSGRRLKKFAVSGAANGATTQTQEQPSGSAVSSVSAKYTPSRNLVGKSRFPMLQSDTYVFDSVRRDAEIYENLHDKEDAHTVEMPVATVQTPEQQKVNYWPSKTVAAPIEKPKESGKTTFDPRVSTVPSREQWYDYHVQMGKTAQVKDEPQQVSGSAFKGFLDLFQTDEQQARTVREAKSVEGNRVVGSRELDATDRSEEEKAEYSGYNPQARYLTDDEVDYYSFLRSSTNEATADQWLGTLSVAIEKRKTTPKSEWLSHNPYYETDYTGKMKRGMATVDFDALSQTDHGLPAYMTKDEREWYAYTKETFGQDEADAYYKTLRGELNRRKHDEKVENRSVQGAFEKVREHLPKEIAQGNAVETLSKVAGGVDSVWNTTKGVVDSIGGGITAAGGDALEYIFKGDIDPYSINNDIQHMAEARKRSVEQKIQNPVMKTAYQIGTSVAETALITAVSMGIGSIAGAAAKATGDVAKAAKIASNVTKAANVAMNSSRVFSSTVQGALERGVDDDEAVALGIVSAAIEGITETWSISKFLDDPTNFWHVGFSNMEEEMAANISTNVADIVITQDKNAWRQAINAYMVNEKMSEEEAFAYALRDRAVELGIDGVAGFLSGVTLSAPSIISKNIAIKTMSDEIRTGLVAAGADAKTARKASHALAKVAYGDTISVADYKLITKNRTARALYNQMIAENPTAQVVTDADGVKSENAAAPVIVGNGRVMTDGTVQIAKSPAELAAWQAEDAALQSPQNENTAENGGERYSIEMDVDGNAFVDVTEDILDPNNGKSVAQTIQQVLSDRFGNVIVANGQKIQVNQTTNREFRNSEAARRIAKQSAQMYDDKLRTIANVDEIVAAARNWVSEQIKHARKDDIVEFSRGQVYYRVGGNGYAADVIIGIRKSGTAVLYDIKNIYSKKIVASSGYYGRQSAPNAAQTTSTTPTISQISTSVNPQMPVLQSTATNEGGNNNGTNVFDGNEGRPAGVGAGGQAGSVRSGTEPSGREGRRIDQLLDRVARSGVHFQSTKSLGISRGTDRMTAREVPPSLWDAEMQEADRRVYSVTGKHLRFVVGMMEINGTRGVRPIKGVRTDTDIIVKADHPYLTPTKIALHEMFHELVAQYPQLRERAWQSIRNKFTDQQIGEIADLYRTNLQDVYSTDEAIMDEVLADAYAGINMFGANTTMFSDAVQNATDTTLGEGRAAPANAAPRAPPQSDGERMSVERKNFTEDKYFKQQIRRWEELSDGTRVKVGVVAEGSPLHQVGFPAERMFFDVGKIRTAMRKHEGQITLADLERISDILNDPIVIDEYKGVEGNIKNSVNVYGEVFTKAGEKPVLVGVTMVKDRSGTMLINKVRTFFSRGDLKNQITDDSVLYLNEDEKRTRKWFQVCDHTVPLEGTKFGLIRSIAYVSEDVKHDTASNGSENFSVDDFELLFEDDDADVDAASSADGTAYVDEDLFGDEDVSEDAFDALDERSLRQIVGSVAANLGLKGESRAKLMQVIQAFDRTRNTSKEKLFEVLEKQLGQQRYDEEIEELAQAKAYIRNKGINVTPDIKSEFGDAEDYHRFFQKNFGKLHFSKEGVSVDVAYEDMRGELQNEALFPADIINPADRLRRIAEVANMSAKKTIVEPLQPTELQRAADMIFDSISEYRDAEAAAKRAREQAEWEKKAEQAELSRRERKRIRREIDDITDTHHDADQEYWRDAVERAREHAAHEEASAMRLTNEGYTTTPEMDELGIKFANPVTTYDDADYLLAEHAAYQELEDATHDAEVRWKATDEEQKHARFLADGVITLPPHTVRRWVMEDLAQYYSALNSIGMSRLDKHKQSVKRQLYHEIDDVLGDLVFEDQTGKKAPKKQIAFGMGGGLMYMNSHRALQQAMHEDEFADKMHKVTFGGIHDNNGYATNFINRMFNAVRFFTDSKGKQRKLTDDESVATHVVLEGRTVEKRVKQSINRQNIEAAAHNLRNGQKPRRVAEEFNLSKADMKLAHKYKWWLEQKAILDTSNIDMKVVNDAVAKYTEMYDKLFVVINQVLVAHGYEPIRYIQGYAPHLQEPETQSRMSTVMRALGIEDSVYRLPTEIAGQTEFFRPGKKWNPHLLSRHGDTTVYDIRKGYQEYVSLMAEMIFHIDDIARIRATSAWFREKFSSNATHEKIELLEEKRWGTTAEKEKFLRENGRIPTSKTVNAEEVETLLNKFDEELREQAARDTKYYSDLVSWLDEFANMMAGKQLTKDRADESFDSRESLNRSAWIRSWIALSKIAANLSSALNQLSQITPLMAHAGLGNTAKAAWWNLASHIKLENGKIRISDEFAQFVAKSPYLTNKVGVKELVPGTLWKNIKTATFKLTEITDLMMSSMAVRAYYEQNLAKGMSETEAMRKADHEALMLMGSRMKGERAVAMEVKSLFTALRNMFQNEVLVMWNKMRHDMPRQVRAIAQEKGAARAAWIVAGDIAKYLLLAFIHNRIAEPIYGATPAPFDVGGWILNFVAKGMGMSTVQLFRKMITDAWEWLNGREPSEDEKREFHAGRAFLDTVGEIADDVPFVNNAAALLHQGDEKIPVPDVLGKVIEGIEIWDEKPEDGEKDTRWESTGLTAGELIAQLIPWGTQIKKTAQGATAMIRGGAYTGFGDDKRLQYPVDGTWDEWIRGVMFGKNALPETDDFYASGEKWLSVKQTQVYEEVVDSGADRKTVYNTILSIRNAEDARSKRDVLEKADLTDEQKLMLYSVISESGKEKLQGMMDAGMSWSDVMAVCNKVDALSPEKGKKSVSSRQKQQAIVKMSLSEKEKMAALSVYMPDSTYRKLEIVSGYDVTPTQWVTYFSAADKDESGNVSQMEANMYLKTMTSLNSQQRAALWQATNAGWNPKSNPFSKSVSFKVQEKLKEE